MAIKNLNEKIHYTKGKDVSASDPLTLGTDGDYFNIIGSDIITEISSLGVGMQVILTFKGSCQIIHDPSKIIIPGATNIITQANDSYKFIEFEQGKWIVVGKPENAIITDPTAIHSDKSNEINQIVGKSNFDLADIFLIEDSTDSWNKKKIPFGQISIDNIADGTNYKKYLQSERDKLIGIEDNADVTDVLNVAEVLQYISVDHLSDITSPGADIEDAVIKRHTQGTDRRLGVQSENSDWGNYRITMLGDPIDSQDAATKNYVDNSAFSFKLQYNGTDLTYDGENLIYYRNDSRDVNAIHKNSSGEITTIVEKTSISSNDIVVIEDSEVRWDKKKIEFITLSDEILSVSNITTVLNSISINALSDITSPGADIEDAVSKRHIQGTDTSLGIQSENSDWGLYRITNLGEPVDNEDAATKYYVDTHGGGGGTDVNAIHVNESDEINGITSKSKHDPQDVFVIEDSKDSMNKKKTSIYQDPVPNSYFIKDFTKNDNLYDGWFLKDYSLIYQEFLEQNFGAAILPETGTAYFLFIYPGEGMYSVWIDKHTNKHKHKYIGHFEDRKGILGVNENQKSIHVFDTQNVSAGKSIQCQSVNQLDSFYFTHYLTTNHSTEQITAVLDIGDNFLVSTYRASGPDTIIHFYVGFESSWTEVSSLYYTMFWEPHQVNSITYTSDKQKIVATLTAPGHPLEPRFLLESIDGGYSWNEISLGTLGYLVKIINIGNDELLYLNSNNVDTSYIYKKDKLYDLNDYRLVFSCDKKINDIRSIGKGNITFSGGSFTDPNENIIGYSNDRGETWNYGSPDYSTNGAFNNSVFDPINKRIFYAGEEGRIIYKYFDKKDDSPIIFYPYLTFGGTAGDCVYASNLGRCIKIGKMVFFHIDIFILTVNSWLSGHIAVDGLPFKTDSSSFSSTCLFRPYNTNQAPIYDSVYGMFFDNSTAIQLGVSDSLGGDWVWKPFVRQDLNDYCEIHLSGHYFTDE